jgi:hypothetical protein
MLAVVTLAHGAGAAAVRVHHAAEDATSSAVLLGFVLRA